MTMTVIWTGMVALSVLCSLATGRGPAVASAAVEGASAAVELALSIAGMLCLWTGVMEVMRQSGLADKLSRLLFPVLRRLFPQAAKDPRIWAWAAPPPRWGSRPPAGWPGAVPAWPLTACVCWWCATPPPSSSSPPPWPPSGPPRAAPLPSTFSPPSGSPPPCRWGWGLQPVKFSRGSGGSQWTCFSPCWSP